jgi:hypothetical protein
MKRLLMMAILVVLAAGEASAASYDVTKMSCDQVKAALHADGKATLRWPSSRVSGMMMYGSYVADPASCSAMRMWARARVKTATGSCMVFQCNQYGHSQRR